MSEDGVRVFAAARHFSLATVERWLAHDAMARDALLAVAERLRLGENHFRDVLDAAEDVAARQGSDVAAVLSTAEVSQALNPDLGRNEAIKALKNALRRLRLPQLIAAEQRLADLVARLGIPVGVRVELPENLEGGEVRVTLRGRSAAELRGRAEGLAAALGRSEVDEIFAVLGGEW